MKMHRKEKNGCFFPHGNQVKEPVKRDGSVSKGTVLIDTPQLIGYDENKGEKWRWRERHGS